MRINANYKCGCYLAIGLAASQVWMSKYSKLPNSYSIRIENALGSLNTRTRVEFPESWEKTTKLFAKCFQRGEKMRGKIWRNPAKDLGCKYRGLASGN